MYELNPHDHPLEANDLSPEEDAAIEAGRVQALAEQTAIVDTLEAVAKDRELTQEEMLALKRARFAKGCLTEVTEVYTAEEVYFKLTGKEAPWLSEEKDEE